MVPILILLKSSRGRYVFIRENIKVKGQAVPMLK
jgi:hypothetical protein